MRRRLARYGRGCFRVLIGPQADKTGARRFSAASPCCAGASTARALQPGTARPVRTRGQAGIAPDRTVLFFAGRVDRGKA
jgi:hypothetical protein